MAIWRTLGFAVVIAVLAPGVCLDLRAAPPMRVGALTARQYIKNKIIDALADGYISPAEYEDIFSKARETLQPQELAGLQRTMDRLMTQTKPRRVEAAESLPLQGVGQYLNRYAGWEPRISRSYQPLPYYQSQRAPGLFAGGIAGSLRRLPYIERPAWNGGWVRQVAREFPRLNEIYPERPTLLSSKSRGGYMVRTMPASAPPVHRTAARPHRVSAVSPSRPSTRIQRVSTTDKMPQVESPVAMAPMPDDEVDRPEDLPAARAPQRSGPDYRTSRTAYLESLRYR
jgi:hypothetical protein